MPLDSGKIHNFHPIPTRKFSSPSIKNNAYIVVPVVIEDCAKNKKKFSSFSINWIFVILLPIECTRNKKK